MSIAGVDIGTTGCKCTVYDVEGSIRGEAYKEYESDGENDTHSLNPNTVWESVCEVIKSATQNVQSIKGIGVTSIGEAAILLDEMNEPLMDSLLYTDTRGKEQCERLINHFGTDYLNQCTGLNPSPMYSISKLMWLKEHHPKMMESCRRICLFEDYIVYKLSGVHQIDYSLASRTMAFDINLLMWNEEILNFAGISIEVMPEVVPIGSKAGRIKTLLAKELDINEDAMIVSGCHDQIAAAIGTGVINTKMAVDGTGTVECITPVFTSEVDKSELYKGSYAIVPFIDNQYVTYAFSLTGGALLKWYRDEIAYMEAECATKRGISVYEHFNKQIKCEAPSGLLVLPHFAGAATPYMDDEAKGAIIGLTTKTTSIEIYQGLMEGVTYEMKINMERLEAAGIEIDQLRATGGGATSKIWMQMKADILNRPIVTLGADQSGTLGCIMLVGVACGLFSDLEEATATFVRLGVTYFPNPEMHKQYMKTYQQYKKLYAVVKGVLGT